MVKSKNSKPKHNGQKDSQFDKEYFFVQILWDFFVPIKLLFGIGF